MMDWIPPVGGPARHHPSDDDSLDCSRPNSGRFAWNSDGDESEYVGATNRAQLFWAKVGYFSLVLILTVMVSASVWGISGAIVGVPIMIIARIALEEDERTRPIALMLAMNVHEEE